MGLPFEGLFGNFPDYATGSTMAELSLVAMYNGKAVNLKDCVIILTCSIPGRNKFYLTSSNEDITVLSTTNGIFRINSQIINQPTGMYNYRISVHRKRIGEVPPLNLTIQSGTWNIITKPFVLTKAAIDDLIAGRITSIVIKT